MSIDIQNQRNDEITDFKKAFDKIASISGSKINSESDSSSPEQKQVKPVIKFGKHKKYVLNRQNKMTVGKQAEIAVTHRSHSTFNRVGQGINGLNSS